MSNLSIHPDKSRVNYQQDILYHINASFNSLTESPSSQIELICFIPDNMIYFYHSPTYPIAHITETPVSNGTHLVFTLAPLPESGIALSFDLYLRFKLITPNLTSYIMPLIVNELDRPSITYYASSVTLSATPNYIASQTTILPNASGGASGQDFVYEIILENIGDLGGRMSQFTLIETLPSSLTLDTSYTITGLDISDDEFADVSSDGLTATLLSPHSFNFSVPNYRGTRYRIRFKGHTASGLEVGNEYITSGSYTYTANLTTSVGPRTFSDIFQIQTPTTSGTVTIYGPNYTRPGALFNTTSSFKVTGNTPLSRAQFHTNIISSASTHTLHLASFQTGTLKIPELNQLVSIPYTISFVTLKGNTIPPLLANSDTSLTVLMRDLSLPNDDEIITIEYTFSAPIPIGAVLDTPLSINAQIDGTSPTPSYISSNTTAVFTSPSGSPIQVDQNFTTLIEHISELAMTATSSPLDQDLLPGDLITYQGLISCSYSPLIEPVFIMILDKKLEYADAVDYEYTDFLGGSTSAIPRPIPLIIPNYGGGSNTIFMISYSGTNAYTFNQLATIKLTAQFRVKPNATGTISQRLLLGTQGGAFVVAPGYDTYNAPQTDGSIKTLLSTPLFKNSIEISMGLTSDFLVKGSLDTDYMQYPTPGHAFAGDSVHYNLSLTNTGSTDLVSVEIVNILPHVGDTGVILTHVNRNSQFTLYPISFLAPTLLPLNPTDPVPIITTHYSQSYDPVRFGSDPDTLIGTVNDWTPTPPSDMTRVKAYKLTLTQGIFRPGQTLSITSLAVVPSGATPLLEAWDSFAAKVSYLDDEGLLHSLLPVEPEMSGIKVMDPSILQVTLGGLVFEDLRKEGIYHLSDPGVNDVAVLLYDGSGHLIRTTFTTPNHLGYAGHYNFSGLPAGHYSLRFVPNTSLYKLTTQVLTDPNGSMPDPATGFTPLIYLAPSTVNLGILAGLTPINQIDVVLKMNKSANKMLRNVIYNQMLLGMKLEDTKKLIP